MTNTVHAGWDDRFEQVVRPFLRSLGDAPLPPDAGFATLGLDSLRSIRLLFAIEDAYGVSFPDDMLGSALFATPGTLWAGLRTLLVAADAGEPG